MAAYFPSFSVVVFFFLCQFCGTFAQTVSPSCLHPVENCSYYSSCVESVIPCGPTGYAIGYGQHYCQMFGTNANLFSTAGQTWIHAVRLCLLQQLVPEITQTPYPTCSALQTYAFSSHVHCYTAPTTDATISACNLGVLDIIALLYTIENAIFDQTQLTLTQGIEVLEVCVNNLLSSAAVGISFPASFLTSVNYTTSFSSKALFSRALCNQLANFAQHSASSMACTLMVGFNGTSSVSLSVAVVPSISFSSPSTVIARIVDGIHNSQLTQLTVQGDLPGAQPLVVPLSSSSTKACNNGPCFTSAQILAQLSGSSGSGTPTPQPQAGAANANVLASYLSAAVLFATMLMMTLGAE